MTPVEVAWSDMAGAGLVERYAGRRVLLGRWRTERAGAVTDWLAWHARLGFDAAVICADADAGPVIDGTIPVTVITNAPPSPAEGSGSFDADTLKVLHDTCLSGAAHAVGLDPCDLLHPPDFDLFAAVDRARGGVFLLQGRRMYPWRLRKGAAAPFHDHIFGRVPEETWLRTWAAQPRALTDARLVDLSAPSEYPIAGRHRATFSRAMGVARPGEPVPEMVTKAHLVEDVSTVRALRQGFGKAPLRRGAQHGSAHGGPLTIVTAMKNEGPYILDWIAHHRAIGVDRFLVYTNDCADGTDALLDRLAEAGIVTHHANPYRAGRLVPQRAAFRAAENAPDVQDAAWLMTLDVDEYLNIHVGAGHLRDLWDAVPGANVISIPWRLFGSGDIVGFEDRPVTHQFCNAAPEYCPKPHQAWGVKTLYRNSGLFERLGVHRPRRMVEARVGDIRWLDGAGRPMPRRFWANGWRVTQGTWGHDLASVNHYAVRGAEAFLVKRDRGRVNHVRRDQGLAYWFRMNHNAVEDTTIRRHDAAGAEERARLAALPGVAEAHDRAVVWHRRRIGELKAMPDHAALFDAITGPRLQRLSRMLGHFGANVFLAGPEVIPDEIAARAPGGDWRFTVLRKDGEDDR